MMRRQVGWFIVFVFVLAAFALLSGVYPPNAKAESAGYGGHGPWTFVALATGEESGYLLNTMTGELWVIRGTIKLPVPEAKPQAAK